MRVYWQQTVSFNLYENIFILPLFSKDTFAEYENLGSQLFFLSLLMISFYCCLASIVVVEKLNSIQFIWRQCLFSLAALKNSVCLVFLYFHYYVSRQRFLFVYPDQDLLCFYVLVFVSVLQYSQPLAIHQIWPLVQIVHVCFPSGILICFSSGISISEICEGLIFVVCYFYWVLLVPFIACLAIFHCEFTFLGILCTRII